MLQMALNQCTASMSNWKRRQPCDMDHNINCQRIAILGIV